MKMRRNEFIMFIISVILIIAAVTILACYFWFFPELFNSGVLNECENCNQMKNVFM